MNNKIKAFLDSHDPACDICGASDFLMLGSTDSESLDLTMRCIKHGDGIERLLSLGGSLPFDPDGALDLAEGIAAARAVPKWTPRIESSIASLDDMKWFKANPGRTHRVRQPRAGDDYFELGGTMIVRHEKSGYSRIPVDEGINLPDAEGMIAAVYELSRKVFGQVAAESADGNLNIDRALARVKVLLWMAQAEVEVV